MHKIGEAGAAADEDCFKAVLKQLVKRQNLADHHIGQNGYAFCAQTINFLLYDFFRQTELRNSIHKDAACRVQRFKHRDLVSHVGQVARACQTGGAGANHSNLVAVGGRFCRCFLAVSHMPVGDKTLQTADANRLTFDAAHAFALTLRFLGAHTAADGRKRGGCCEHLVRFLKLTVCHVGNEIRDGDHYGAATHAGLVFAVQAALSFANGHLFRVSEGNFLKIVISHVRLLFRHRRFCHRHIRHFFSPHLFLSLLHQTAVEFPCRFAFHLRVGSGALHDLIKVHKVSVKIRPIHAGELCFTAHGHTAAAAHARAINHDTVHADNSFDSVFFCQIADGFHHGKRADGYNEIIFGASFDVFFQGIRDKTFVPVGTVICHQIKVIAGSTHFVFQNDDIFVAEAGNHVDFCAEIVQGLGLRIRNGTARTAADDSGIVVTFQLRGLAERTDEIQNAVALVQRIEQHGCFANLLKNNIDCSRFSVIISDGQRNSLSILIDAQNNKLSGLRFMSNIGRSNAHLGHTVVQALFLQDLKHFLIPPVIWIYRSISIIRASWSFCKILS